LRVLASSQIKSWSIEGIHVSYARFYFLDAFKRWDASNLFNGALNISTEDGNIFVIPQWCASFAISHDNHVLFCGEFFATSHQASAAIPMPLITCEQHLLLLLTKM
jgi:hypothetical protein